MAPGEAGLTPGVGRGRLAGKCADAGVSSPPDDRICSPPFMELTSLCGDDTMQLLEKNGLAFPFSVYRAPGTRGPYRAVKAASPPGPTCLVP